MSRFVLTPIAREDLIAIRDFIANESQRAARRVLSEIRAAMRRIAASPGIGHLREDLADEPLRFWTVYSFLIIYRPGTKPVEVVRVLHGARDVQSLLEGK